MQLTGYVNVSRLPSKARLFGELELVRKQSFADEEHRAGLRSIAAPIYSAAGEVSAGVALNGSSAEPARNDSRTLIDRVKDAGSEISRRSRF